MPTSLPDAALNLWRMRIGLHAKFVAVVFVFAAIAGSRSTHAADGFALAQDGDLDAFGDMREQLERLGATVVIAQFGRIESLAGPEDSPQFAKAYRELVDQFQGQARLVVLVTPTPFEKPPSPLIPDLSKRNLDLALRVKKTASISAEREAGFVSMFDGETLDGWSVSNAKAAKAWTVRDGAIVGDGDAKGDEVRSYLVYDKNREIADFELKFSYRLPGKGNTGVSIRARKDDTGKRDFQGYHADLGHVGIGKQVLGAWDFHTPGRREHACFRGDRLVIDENDNPTVTKIDGAVTVGDIRKDDWNEVHVVAKGNSFRFFINGKPASEFTEHLPPDRRLAKGMIQLQLHDPGMVVYFKDLRIKILEETQ